MALKHTSHFCARKYRRLSSVILSSDQIATNRKKPLNQYYQKFNNKNVQSIILF